VKAIITGIIALFYSRQGHGIDYAMTAALTDGGGIAHLQINIGQLLI